MDYFQSTASLWVFGYGSLVWNPGFEYKASRVGFIRGYARRFWQGNTTHRGTPQQPGRVATLIEDSQGITWGRAFQLIDESSFPALDYLDTREGKLGGYRIQIVPFETQIISEEKENEEARASPTSTAVPVLVYVATVDNPFYLGPAPIEKLAVQIASTGGNCGHNAEYVLRLADFMRNFAPKVLDDHLFALEFLVKERLREKNVSIDSVYGHAPQLMPDEGQGARPGEGDAQHRPNSFQFTATLPSKKLRCLKV